MCGIAGYLGGADRNCIACMIDLLSHRGPDASGRFHDGQLSLGHSRLSIVDLGQGQQPMQTADGALTVIFNGEIYNHTELRSSLEAKGHRFLTDHSDTEVLLHGYREWGASLPDRLNGMWAFAIYDASDQQLFLSRDRFGQKPLFYAQRGETFVFASELSAVLAHPAIEAKLSPKSIRKYFGYGFIPAPHSAIEGVHKLPGGHNLIYDIQDHRLRITRYWSYEIEPREDMPGQTEDALGEELRHLLAQAVRRRLMADVPLGVLLSGGIDSSAVAAMAAREAEHLQTFSIGFQEQSYDESPYAALVARQLNTDHHLSILSQDEVKTYGYDVLDRMDEPMADDSLLPTFLVCRETRKHVTVALGGDGGDELFAGYEPFRVLHWARRYRRYLPAPVHEAIEALAGLMRVSGKYMSFEFKCKRFLRGARYAPSLWVPLWMSPLFPEDLAALLAEPIDPEEVYEEAIASWERCASSDPVDKVTQYYVDLYLQEEILVKGDRASMMNGLELRCPFLDIDLVNFARTLPASYRLRGYTTKYMLKKALEPVLPPEILYRPKQGFSPPTGQWFRDDSLQITPARSPVGVPSVIAQKLASHKAGQRDEKLYLWSQLALERFAGKYL